MQESDFKAKRLARGMIARTGCPDDRRQASLAITAKGKSVLYGVWSDTQAAIAEKIKEAAEEAAQKGKTGVIANITA